MATRPKRPNLTPTRSMAIRLEHDLVARLERAAAQESKPGLVLSRSDLVKVLLEEGLARRGLGKAA